MGTPDKDVIVEHIQEQRRHLESERDKFTEAAVKLGREKAALEVGYIMSYVSMNVYHRS
jgi:hypothetical protein